MKRIIFLVILSASLSINHKSFSNFLDFDALIIATSKLDISKNIIEITKNETQIFLKLTPEALNIDMLFIKHGQHGPEYEIINWIKIGEEILIVRPPIQTQIGDIILNHSNVINSSNIIIDKFQILNSNASNNFYKIDISSLFINVPKGLPGSSESVIERLSFVENIFPLDNEIIIRTIRTIAGEEFQDTNQIDFSIVLLPKPMTSRLFDHRMGFMMDTGISGGYFTTTNAAIRKFRLKKKNPKDSISDPIKPIIFYYDIDMPEIWKPYIKAGIEEWLPAFEAAGFSNALKVLEMPNIKESYKLNSINYNIIKWDDRDGVRDLSSTGTATVHNIVDLRSGEILKADIFLSSTFILQEYMEWYIVRCAPLDVAAQTYPISNERLGYLFQDTVAHEAGHAFGIMDGNYGEFTYPFDKMRSEEWLKEMGFTPSIFNYARFNNLVQSEDNIPPHLLIQKVGPTDIYSIQYGYTEFPNIDSYRDERKFLEKIIRRQDSVPWFRLNRGYTGSDTGIIVGPGNTNEVVDNADPVNSATLALINLKKTYLLLPKITKNQENDAALRRLYDLSNSLWKDEMKQVLSLIGGFTSHYKSGNQEGPVYCPVEYEKQIEAMDFLVTQAFNNAEFLYHPRITQRIGTDSSVEKIASLQTFVLADLLSPDRLKRLEETEMLLNQPNLTENILTKLQLGIWKEIFQKNIKIDSFKMELQMAYIDIIEKIIKKEDKEYLMYSNNDTFDRYSDNIVSKIYSHLNKLKKHILNVLNSSKDDNIRAHLKLALLKINEVII